VTEKKSGRVSSPCFNGLAKRKDCPAQIWRLKEKEKDTKNGTTVSGRRGGVLLFFVGGADLGLGQGKGKPRTVGFIIGWMGGRASNKATLRKDPPRA